MKKLLIFMTLISTLIADDKTDDYFSGQLGSKIQAIKYPISMNNSQCHCQFYISEAFIRHTENDITAQLYQMNIDERNFAKHFLGDEMKLGLKNELIGITENKLAVKNDNVLLDEMIFLVKKLNNQSQIQAQTNNLITKSNTSN